MLTELLPYFRTYPQSQAPFLHRQLAEWQTQRPLHGLKVLHHVPLVPNTLLKIACVVAAGAEVVVTNPNFVNAHPEAVLALNNAGIPYVADFKTLKGRDFDLYYDCGADLYEHFGAPRLGSVELTATGDQFYRSQKLDFPVVSIDLTLTKQLETVFGTAESINQALRQLTGLDISQKSWMVFGFGKIGRGLAYFCVKNKVPLIIADLDPEARAAAQAFGLQTLNPEDQEDLQAGLAQTELVVTATGRASILNPYPKAWFQGKILANMGVLDEYGPQFDETEVLNKKLAVNFVLSDPTPIQYIDPELYAHNIAALEILQNTLAPGVSTLSKKTDQDIIETWCKHQGLAVEEVTRWFKIPPPPCLLWRRGLGGGGQIIKENKDGLYSANVLRDRKT